MKKITREVLDQIVRQHQLWLDSDGDKGERADLQGADLRGAYLVDAYLDGANFGGSNLRFASLGFANLHGANLHFADLQSASLCYANLQGANLGGANLSNADLFNADHRCARFNTNIRNCLGFSGAKFTPDALPWLILHPRWPELKDTVRIETE